MGFINSTKLLAVGAVWRFAGSPKAADTLIEAANSNDESDQALAGMLLVQAGDRSVTPLENALTSGTGSLELIDVLASIGTDRAHKGLKSLADTDGDIGAAATQALRDLDDMGRMTD